MFRRLSIQCHKCKGWDTELSNENTTQKQLSFRCNRCKQSTTVNMDKYYLKVVDIPPVEA